MFKLRVKAQELTLSDMLIRRLGGRQKARSHKKLHASDVTRIDPCFCPRQHAIEEVLGLSPPDVVIEPATQAAFDYGRAIETVAHEWLSDCLWGNWTCKACGMGFIGTKPEYCIASFGCPGNDFDYHEHRFVDQKDTGIDCGVDLLVRMDGDQLLTIVELKTMDKDQFKALKAPLAEHKVRTALYAYIVSKNPVWERRIHTDHARVLYVSKGYGSKNADEGNKVLPFKDFKVIRNEVDINPYLIKARQLTQFRLDGTLPPRVCPSSQCERTRDCLLVKQCFQMPE